MTDIPIDLEPDRYQITEASGRVFLVDTSTGKTWVLKHLDTSKPVWVSISKGSE